MARLDTRVQFTRRSVISPRQLGPYGPLLTVWARYMWSSGREQQRAGQDVAFEAATLRIRDSAPARDLTIADRATVAGRDHRITSISLPTRSGFLEIAITTDLGES